MRTAYPTNPSVPRIVGPIQPRPTTSSCQPTPSTYHAGSHVSFEMMIHGATHISGEAEFPAPSLATCGWQDDLIQSQLVETHALGKFTQKTKVKIESDAHHTEELMRYMVSAIRMGNLDTALLIFAGMETKQVNEMAQSLVKNMQDIQSKRRELSQKLSNLSQDANGSKQLMQLQQDMNTLDGDMGIYQQIMKDLLQQKQQALELASGVSQSEHQTAMSILRK